MILVAAFILLFAALLGAPLFVVIGGLALVCFFHAGIDISAVIIELYRMASAPVLVAIPLFTFSGYLLAESKTPERLIRLYRELFGWMPAGLALTALVVCAFFTAFTGASGVTIIALGGLLFPMFIKEGYSERFSLGLLTTSGSLGLLFPPSLPLILYGLIAAVNVENLFIAGIAPGALLVLVLGALSLFLNRSTPRRRFKASRAWSAVKDAIWIIPLPFIVVVGIYGGFFAVSEAAVVTVVYTIVLETLIYRDIKSVSEVLSIMSDSMVMVGGILIILGVALGFTNYLIYEQVPMKVLGVMKGYITSRVMFLAILNVFLLIVGCLMDIFSAIIVVVPLILPIAREFGVDPIHLGIIFLTNLEIGYSTPPVGLNLFISSFRFRRPIVQLYRASLPFLLAMFVVLIVITYLPDLSLLLVELWSRP